MKIKLMLIMMLLVRQGWSQHFSEKITKELSFEKSTDRTIMVFNINGKISVTGYDGDKVLVEVDKAINAKTDRRLEAGKEQVRLGVIDRADTLLLFVEGLCGQFGKRTDRRNGNGNKRTDQWGYQWSNSNHNGCNEEFDYTMNFTIKVPRGVNVYVSTINEGDITVENITGAVSADNINGSIGLKNISGSTYASTINGTVDLEYAQNPAHDCRYYSLNGDINASYRKGLKANVNFESFNGELYTNVAQLETMPSALEKREGEKGIKYKVGNNRYKIGSGGILLDFETFNGNVYLKEKMN